MHIETKKSREIGWVNLSFLTLSPPVAILSLYYWLHQGSFNWNTIILTLIFTTIIQVSITAGYHRLFSHRCFQATWPVRLFFLIFGAAAFEGSALSWSLDHRDHHNYVDDVEKDPYSINKGFFWAHLGWMLFKPLDDRRDESKAGDLLADPLVVWQDKYWVGAGLLSGYLLPALIALAWGDFFGGLMIAGLLRAVINHHSTFLINSLSHCLGKQTYSDSHSARDNLFTAFLTFGEGYHNFHHEFPSDYRNGPRCYDWDPTKWIIKCLSFVGMTSNLKTIAEEIIIRKRWQMREKRLHQKLSLNKGFAFFDNGGEVLTNIKAKAEETFKQLRELRNKHRSLIKDPHSMMIEKLDEINLEIKDMKEEFLYYARQWNRKRQLVLAKAGV